MINQRVSLRFVRFLQSPRWFSFRRRWTASNGSRFFIGYSWWRSGRRRQLLHRIFKLGVIAKGIDGALELVGGLLLLVLSPSVITGTIMSLLQGELKEDPTDLIANLLVHSTQKVVQTRESAAVFLIVHGVVKLGLVGGLATNKLWSYPVAIVVFTGFTVYQAYQLAQQSSLFLAIVTVLDVVVVLVIIAEYRHVGAARKRNLEHA